MGSGKKHKTDKHRKRHRSRSRSHSAEREKLERPRHHKKHKKRERKEYDSDVEIVDAPPPPKISKTSHLSTPPPPEISRHKSPSSPSKGNSSQSLSIEETNKLRAKLGLKPLEVESGPKDNGGMIKDDLGEFYHKPAKNISEKTKTDKIKEKITVHKEKRKIETNLQKVKTLGECDEEDDAAAWVRKSRKLEEEKKKAEQRAKMLDQLDEEFGIGKLVEEEVRNERRKAYSEKDLKGLHVEHDIGTFEEGSMTILTLKDQGVLDGEDDTLVNVNMVDDERYQKNILVKRKKPTYNALEDEEMELEESPAPRILRQYDEEIDGEKKKSFAIGVDNAKEILEKREALMKSRMINKNLESLLTTDPKIASEYYDQEELAKFKKKKKRKVRSKMLKAEDLIKDNHDYLRDLGSRRRRPEENVKADRALDVDDVGAPKEDLSNVKIDEEEHDFQLQLALNKTRQAKQSQSSIDKLAKAIKQEVQSTEESKSGSITLNSTAEFCRTLGDIPTYGLAGNREETEELMDFDTSNVKEDVEMDEEESDGRGTWNTVKIDQKTAEPVVMEAAILDAEPSLGQGVGGALQLAMSKGYLQKEETNRPSASRFAHLQAQNYSIEDKTYGDDDKFGRRDRFNGPTSDFKEKDGFKPNVKLDYIDDKGLRLNAKEAFRYLSHKFHGKGPGKNKVEKRMKKSEQEVLMQRMSSTDTPLGTLTLLQAKQKETQSPFIVLSGSKQMQATSISKTKH